MDGKAGVLFPLRVVRLMCTRFLTVSRVCIKGSSSLKTGGETYSEVQYLSSERAVGMASARRIVLCEGGVSVTGHTLVAWD